MVNPPVRRSARSRTGRIGRSSKRAKRSGLASTSRMTRRIVILSSPLASMVVAPSRSCRERQRTSAVSENTGCENGRTE